MALCSHPLFLVGVDVAAPRAERPGGGDGGGGGGGGGRGAMVPVTPIRRPLQAHLAAFRSQLADSEVGGAHVACDTCHKALGCRREHVLGWAL